MLRRNLSLIKEFHQSQCVCHSSRVSLFFSKVFDMAEEEHDIILQKVQESKVRFSDPLLFRQTAEF